MEAGVSGGATPAMRTLASGDAGCIRSSEYYELSSGEFFCCVARGAPPRSAQQQKNDLPKGGWRKQPFLVQCRQTSQKMGEASPFFASLKPSSKNMSCRLCMVSGDVASLARRAAPEAKRKRMTLKTHTIVGRQLSQ